MAPRGFPFVAANITTLGRRRRNLDPFKHGTEVAMLERYFVRPDTVDRIRASWIGEAVERYVGWLAEHGYATRTVLRRVPILVGFGTFAADRGAARWDELPAHVDAFVANWLRTHGGHATAVARRKDATATLTREFLSVLWLGKCPGKIHKCLPILLLGDLHEIAAQLKEPPLLGGRNETSLALCKALVEVVDVNPKHASYLVEPTCRNTVDALLVFMLLLVGDADQLGELVLGHSAHDPAFAQTGSDVTVHILRPGVTSGLLSFHQVLAEPRMETRMALQKFRRGCIPVAAAPRGKRTAEKEL